MAYAFQTFSVGEVLTATKMNQIEVNIRDHEHGLSGVSGAKVMVSTNDTTPDYLINKLTSTDITISEVNDGADEDISLVLAAGSVAQSELKTASGTVSTAGSGRFTLPGGQYGFFPALYQAGGLTSSAVLLNGSANGSPPNDLVGAGTTNDALSGMVVSETSATPQLCLMVTGGTLYALQRYIQASPPYDLGNGSICIFVFVRISSDGKIASVYVAQEPPWALNGPTDITPSRVDKVTGRKFKVVPRGFGPDWRARLKTMMPAERTELIEKVKLGDVEEIEITQEIKNKDMPLIPHPFADGAGGGTIVLIDPVGFADELAKCHECGIDVNELIHEGYVRLDNAPLSANTPPGVVAVRARWKLT